MQGILGGVKLRKSPRLAQHKYASKFQNVPGQEVANKGMSVWVGNSYTTEQNTGIVIEDNDDFVLSKTNMNIDRDKDNKMTGKRLAYDTDDGGDIDVPIGKQNMRNRKNNRRHDNFGACSVEDDMPAIRTRQSPKSLCDAVKFLFDEQKACVNSMGFGMLLHLNVDSLPAVLGYYVVDKLNTSTMTLNLERGSIRITKDIIHQLIGVPNGGHKITRRQSRSYKDISKTWKGLYGSDDVSPSNICQRLRTYAYADWMFRIDFTMLFVGTMVDSQKNGKCLLYILQYLTQDSEVNSLDWCDYIFRIIRESKDDWSPNEPDCYFTGPLTILVLLYVESTILDGLSPTHNHIPVAEWTFEKLKERQRFEIETGGFGRGNIRGISECGGVHVETPSDDESFQVMIDRLEDILHRINVDKNEFESTMKQASLINPGSELLATLRCKFDGISEHVNGRDVNVNAAKTDTVNMSQFWNDPETVRAICRSVDQLEKSVGKRVVGTSPPIDEEPSFSLGLTQEARPAEFVTPICEPKEVLVYSADCARRTGPSTSNSADFKTNEHVQGKKRNAGDQEALTLVVGCERSKRTTRLGYQLRSPYMNRPVDITKDEHRSETRIWEYLWRTYGPDTQVIFLTSERRKGIRVLFETLQPSGDISSNVIDCWSAVLNHEEGKGSDDSPSRLFCTCTELNRQSFGFKDVQLHVAEARVVTNLKLSMKEDKSKMGLFRHDLVFYPIKMMNHHFLVCFDLKHAVTYVVDSIDVGRRKRRLKVDRMRDQNYMDECNITVSRLKGFFASYLESVGHSKASIIDARNPVRLQLNWATAENYSESGVFTMRHMETFMGGGVRKWNCGLVAESTKQGGQLFSLRKKYAAKILLSDINLKRDEISREADVMGRELM